MEKARVNGVELAYELVAAGGAGGGGKAGQGGEAIVLLNGIGMSIGNWRPLLPLLGVGRPVLLHDMRGQLLSGKPRGRYSLELHARDLAALMDSQGISKADIVGTSYGSEVGLVFARLFPARCSSLVVIDGVSEVGPLLKAAVLAWRSAALAGPEAFLRSLIPWTYSERYIRENEEAFEARVKTIASLPRDYFEAFAELCDSFLAIDETVHLAEIACPTLVLVGSEDILKHPGYAGILADGIEGAVLRILPGLGHGGVIEDPEGRVHADTRVLVSHRVRRQG